jgi:hypothetical protein
MQVVGSVVHLTPFRLIDRLSRPSENITGMSRMVPEMAVKRLELLRELIPGIPRVLVPSFLAAARRPRFHQVGVGASCRFCWSKPARFSFGTRGRFVPYLSSEAVGLSFMRFPLALILVMLASTAHAQSREQKPVDWRTFEIPDFGTRIQYPAGIFSPAGKPEKGVGQRFERADGRAVLSIYSRPNEAGENPTTYLRHNLRMERSALDYVRITRSFFAISSLSPICTQGGSRFFSGLAPAV